MNQSALFSLFCNFQVQFTESVKWMVLEFDAQCGTAQAEDTLQLYIPCHFKENSLCPLTGQEEEDDQQPTSVLWPVLKKFHGTNWPKSAVVLPGKFSFVFIYLFIFFNAEMHENKQYITEKCTKGCILRFPKEGDLVITNN